MKPENIAIASDGRVKLLDFGIARLRRAEIQPSEDRDAPTLATPTVAGTVLGTAAYMSPEQVRGQEVDRRTDIWSFGCCLVEALTGRPPFQGSDMATTWSNILNEEPDLDALSSRVPPEVCQLTKRCLVKDKRRRLQDIGRCSVFGW